MAYIVDSRYKQNVNGTTISPDVNPTHVTNDYLVMIVGADGGGATFTAPTQDSGWSTVTGIALQTGGVACDAFYIKCTSGSMAIPSATYGATDDLCCYVFSVRDAHGTTFVDTVGTSSGGNTWKRQTDAHTTTTNGALVIYGAISDSERSIQGEPGIMQLPYVPRNGAVNIEVGWTIQETAGAAPRPTWYGQGSGIDGISGLVFSIRPDSDDRPGYVDFDSPPSTIINPCRSTSASNEFGGAEASIVTDVATIDSVTNNNFALTLLGGQSPNGLAYGQGFTNQSAGAAQEIYTRLKTCTDATTTTSFDFSTDNLIVAHMGVREGYLGALDVNANNGLIFGLRSPDGGGNGYKFWKAYAPDTSPPAKHNVQPVVIDVTDASSLSIDEDGTFDDSAVDGFVLGGKKGAGISMRIALAQVQQLHTVVMKGGSAAKPLTFEDAYDALVACDIHTIQKLGDSAYRSLQGLQLGNGTDPTYTKHQNTSWSFATPASDASSLTRDLQAPATYNDLVIYGSASCHFDLSKRTLRGPTDWPFTMHASTSSAATYIFTDLVLLNCNPTFQDVGSTTGAGTLLNHAEVTHNDFDFSNGWTFEAGTDGQAITLSGATQVALQAKVDNIANCPFKSQAVGVRIEYTGTGDVSLNFDNITGSGNTVDLHYNSTNASALTCVLQNGSDFSTSSISGAATGVTFSNDKTFTVTSNVSAEITILRTGTQTIEDEVETNTTLAHVFTPPLGFNVDVQVHAAGYISYWEENRDLGSVDSSLSVTLEPDPAYV